MAVVDNIKCNLMSFNVRGLNEERKRLSIFRYIKKHKVDICMLQETFSTPECEQKWINDWGGKVIFCHGTNRARGNMILFCDDYNYEIKEIVKDNSGRITLLKIKLQDCDYILLNIYSPTDERSKYIFYCELSNFLKTHVPVQFDKLIIGGDFNLVLDYQKDRHGVNNEPSNYYFKCKRTLLDILSRYNMIDIWRQKNPQSTRYTWRRPKPPAYSRIDMWFISDVLEDRVDKVDILSCIRSDHSPTILNFNNLETESSGSGYWKFNNLFLEEEYFLTELENNFNLWLEDCIIFNDDRVTWEFLKYKIRQFSIKYGKD